MAVRARWGLESIDIPVGDPYAERQMTLADGPVVEEVGKPIDLSGDTAALSAQLVGLADRERQLYEQGVECAIKDRSDTSCHACAARGRHGGLCELGVEEERLATQIALLANPPDGG